MSTKTFPSTKLNMVAELDDVPREVLDRSIELAFAFIRADVADPEHFEIPRGAALALIPDDDPELAELATRAGLAGVKRGQNVYFLHLTHDKHGALAIKWPEERPSPQEPDDQ